jgi:Tfp pilus assembly protein PilV
MADIKVSKSSQATGGFTVIEVLVSITLLFLGVIVGGAVMIITERGALASEDRYRDTTELRNRIESIKAALSSQSLATSSLALARNKSFTGSSGNYGSAIIEGGAAGIPNLVRVEMDVVLEGSPPIRLVTYMKADEN